MEVTAELVSALIREQFPRWADRTVTPVTPSGWDNRTFRLGDDLVVRLSSAGPHLVAEASGK